MARILFTFGLVAVHLAKVLFSLARDLFTFGQGPVYFGLVALHLAQVLFILARDLFNFGQGPV